MRRLKEKLVWFLITIGFLGIAYGQVLISETDRIHQLETDYFNKNGKYLQILEGNKLPSYEPGTISEKLGENIDQSYKVDVYKTPKGEHGYTVFFEDSNNYYAVSEGPEKASRDFIIPKPIEIATTTSSLFSSFFSSLFPKAYAITNAYTTSLALASSQYWSITDAAQTGLDITTDLSISAWVFIDTEPDDEHIVSKRDDGENVAYQFLFAGFVDVTINVNDTEGASIVGNTIDVFSSDGKKLEFTGSGRGSYNFRAKGGAYNVKII